jgi:hypothetical protein
MLSNQRLAVFVAVVSSSFVGQHVGITQNFQPRGWAKAENGLPAQVRSVSVTGTNMRSQT